MSQYGAEDNVHKRSPAHHPGIQDHGQNAFPKHDQNASHNSGGIPKSDILSVKKRPLHGNWEFTLGLAFLEILWK